MPNFGQPARGVAQDANAGVVNPPAKKFSTRTMTAQSKQITALDEGIETVGAKLGNALASKLTDEANNINEQRAIQATIRQGQEKGINSVDATKKREDWTEGVFGQNVEYRAAQQRAVQNTIQADFMTRLSELESYAHETPEVYAQRLQDGLDKSLELYKDDPETKNLVKQAWMTSSQKLSQKHYEEHFAHNQLQQRESFATSIRQTFDQLTLEASKVNTPEEAQELIKHTATVFKAGTKPETMSTKAWRSVLNEEVNNSLRHGNIGAYNAAKANGWVKTLTPAEKVRLDQAISAYDTDFAQDVSTMYQEAQLNALQAQNLDDASGVYHSLLNSIDSIAGRSTLTPRANLALATGRVQAQKGIESIEEAKRKARERADKIAKDAVKEAKKKQDKIDRTNTIKDALSIPHPIDQAGAIEDIEGVTEKELSEALDVKLIEDVSRIVGSEEVLTESQAIKVMMTDPKVAKTVALSMRNTPVKSGLVKRTLETFVNGWHNLIDENHRLNDDGILAMQATTQFAQGVKNFKSMVGTANYDKFEIIKRGLSVGQTKEQLERDIQDFEEAQGNMSDYASKWNTSKKVDKRIYVQNLVKDFVGQRPEGDSLAYYMEDYNRALAIYKGDHDRAAEYLFTTATEATVNYKGIAIPNGKFLNEIHPDYNFSQLMNEAQRTTGNEPSMLTSWLINLGVEHKDESGKVLTTLDQIDHATMYTVDGIDGVYIDSPKALQPILITTDVLRHFGTVATQRKEWEAIRREMDDKAADRWLKEQQELREAQPITLF